MKGDTRKFRICPWTWLPGRMSVLALGMNSKTFLMGLLRLDKINKLSMKNFYRLKYRNKIKVKG